MKFKIFSLLALGCGLLLSSCGDDGADPVVTISSPAEGTTAAAGTTLVVSGTATDDVEVSSLRVESATSSLQLSGEIPLTNIADRISFQWGAELNLDSLLTEGEYEVDFIATDSDGNQGSDRLTFNIQ